VPAESLDEAAGQALRARILAAVTCRTSTKVGVGLSLSYHLIQALGGELEYASDGRGTRFWFSLPSALAPPRAAVAELLPGTRLNSADRIADSSLAARLVGASALLDQPAPEKSASVPTAAAPVGPHSLPQAQHKGTVVSSAPSRASQKRKPEPGARSGAAGGAGLALDAGSGAVGSLSDAAPRKRFQSADPLGATGPAAVAAHGLAASSRPHVLLVEDSAVCAKMMGLHLRKLQCSCTIAENGRVAVDLLRGAARGLFTLVLMDLRMPVMDGFEACGIIKRELDLAALPVVAVSGETGLDAATLRASSGFDGFLSKPVKQQQVKEVLEAFCNTHEV